MQEQHGHCMLCNFPEQIASLQYAGQQLDQVDYSSSVEALQQHNKTKSEVTSKAEHTSSSRSMSAFVKKKIIMTLIYLHIKAYRSKFIKLHYCSLFRLSNSGEKIIFIYKRYKKKSKLPSKERFLLNLSKLPCPKLEKVNNILLHDID